MSGSFYNNNLEDENSQNGSSDRLSSSVSNKLNDLNLESQLSSERILKMQETIASLKSELQSVVIRVEQNVGVFKGKITSKIGLVLNLLKKKQIHIQSTLDNCYKIIDNLIETFLNVGHELEKDIVVISLKVNDFDNEIKAMLTGCNSEFSDNTFWFINDEGRLTKRKNIVIGPNLPKFKCGDKKVRKSLIIYFTDVFSKFQVPKHLWVQLASNQLIGMARDWWNMHDKKMNWSQFSKSFIAWSFDDNCIRSNNYHLPKQDENDIGIMRRSVDAIKDLCHSENTFTNSFNTHDSKLLPSQSELYTGDVQNPYKQRVSTNSINSFSTSVANHNIDDENDANRKSSCEALQNCLEESDDCEELSGSKMTSSKRKYSIYTNSTDNSNLKKRKALQTDKKEERNPTFINGRYKFRKRK